jgi:hypothetical protein
MEGNFRIVQYSENEFGIEREIELDEPVKKISWYGKEKTITRSYWVRCNIDGKVNTFSLFAPRSKSFKPYSTTDLSVCRERLRRIKEFPKVIE